MLARLFVIFGGLFVLALLAALIGPFFINWTNYKADFEREASAVLGRKVTVERIASARLLPFPSVTFSNVKVGDGAEPAMTVDTFSMDAELAPFMRGELLIFDMRIERPRATIHVDDQGVIDWTVRPSTPFDPRQIAIEKMTVSDAAIVIDRGAVGTHALSELDAELSAKSLAGPWRVEARLKADGRPMTVSATTGALDEKGQMRLRLRARPDGATFAVETDGNVGIADGVGQYGGTFKVFAAADAPAEGSQPNAAPAVKAPADPGMRLSGDFALDYQRLDIPAFRFESGPVESPYTADGSAQVFLGADPSFSVVAKGAQVRFDETVGGGDAALTLAQRLDSLERALTGLPLPTIPGTVEVSLPAVVAGDTTVRDVELRARPEAMGWAVQSARATLPGRTTLEASGFLSTGQGIGFKGKLLLAVAQPSGFAAWVSSDVDEAIRRLPAAGFSADVEMNRARQSFRNAELILGNARFKGSLESRADDGVRPSMALKLDGGALDVEGLRAFASLFVSDTGISRFAERDFDFDIKAGPVSVGGLSADTLDTALRLREGVLEIDRLSIGGLAGASISATGRLADLATQPTGKIDASIIAVDLAPLIALAAERFAGNAVLDRLAQRARGHGDLFQDAEVDVVASVARNDDGSSGLALSGQGHAGGTKFSLTLAGEGDRAAPQDAPITFGLTAANDDATQLLALSGLTALPLGVVGPGEIEINAKGKLSEGLATTAGLRGEDMKVGFGGTVGMDDKGMVLQGNLTADAADIEPWLMTTGYNFPGMGTGTALNFAADADYGDGLLVLGNLHGAVNEASVAGDVNMAFLGDRPKLSGSLQVDELDLAPFAAMLLGDQARGFDDKARATPFAANSVAPFEAELDITAGTLSAGTALTAYDAALSLTVAPDALKVAGLKAMLFDGALSGAADVKNEAGSGLFSGQFTLDGVDLQSALADSGLNGKARIAVALTASGKSFDGMLSSLAGSGTVSAGDLVIDRLNPAAFPAIVAEADRVGRDIDAAKVAAFAPALVADGRFAARPVDVAFTVAGGVLRLPAVTLTAQGAAVSADLRADLAQGTFASTGTIAYQPGDEALAGAEPALGIVIEGGLVDAVRRFDTAPLAQFLTQRALEKEQARVEAMQADLLEKQRLRREARYYTDLEEQRRRAAEEARLRAEAEARAKAEAEARAAEEARLAEQARQEAERRRAEDEAARQRQTTPDGQIERAPLPTPQPPVPPLKLDGPF